MSQIAELGVRETERENEERRSARFTVKPSLFLRSLPLGWSFSLTVCWSVRPSANKRQRRERERELICIPTNLINPNKSAPPAAELRTRERSSEGGRKPESESFVLVARRRRNAFPQCSFEAGTRRVAVRVRPPRKSVNICHTRSGFRTSHACDRRTDGRTSGQTDCLEKRPRSDGRRRRHRVGAKNATSGLVVVAAAAAAMAPVTVVGVGDERVRQF